MSGVGKMHMSKRCKAAARRLDQLFHLHQCAPIEIRSRRLQIGLHGSDRLVRGVAKPRSRGLTQRCDRQIEATPDLSGVGRERRPVHAVKRKLRFLQRGPAVMRFNRHRGYFFAPSGYR